MKLFKNTAFKVTLVEKDEDGAIIVPPVETQADVIAFAGDVAESLIKKTLLAALVYVAADTARKGILAWIEK